VFRKKKTQESSPDALKKKTLVCSSEAAAISIGIHVLLLIFAGSWVAIKYVQDKNNEFQGENIARRKLERRQLVLPTKVKNLQKKSSRPKVTSRMAVNTKQTFSLPEMSNLDIGFDRSGRSVGGMGMTGGLGFGIAGIDFFGAKSKGEKVVFILDASEQMMVDEKGGFNTYKFAKERVLQMIDRMSSATLFNMMVYVDNNMSCRTTMFSKELVPATPANRSAVQQWLAPLNTDPRNVSNYRDLPGRYNGSAFKYESVVRKPTEFVLPVQAAMEQKADNIFILCKGWGSMRIPKADAMELRGETEGSGLSPEKVDENRESRKKAEQMLEEENKKREAEGLPPRIVANMRDYIEEKGLPYNSSGAFMGEYTFDELMDHMEAVYEMHYKSDDLKRPRIHIVKLIAADGTGVDQEEKRKDQEKATDRFNNLKRFAKEFRGEFELLRGAKTIEDILQQNRFESEPGTGE